MYSGGIPSTMSMVVAAMWKGSSSSASPLEESRSGGQIGEDVVVDTGGNGPQDAGDQKQDRDQNHQFWLSCQRMGNFLKQSSHLPKSDTGGRACWP